MAAPTTGLYNRAEKINFNEMKRLRTSMHEYTDGTGYFNTTVLGSDVSIADNANTAENGSGARYSIADTSVKKIKELQETAARLKADQDSRLEEVNQQIVALREQASHQNRLVIQDEGMRTLRFDADQIQGIRASHVEGLQDEIRHMLDESKFRKGDRVHMIGAEYIKGQVKDATGGLWYVAWDQNTGYGTGWYNAEQIEISFDQEKNTFRIGDQVEHVEYPDSIGVIQMRHPDGRYQVAWIYQPNDAWITSDPTEENLRPLPMGEKIQKIEQDKAELRQQVEAQQVQVAQLAEMLNSAMTQITELREQGKQEEADQLESEFQEISGLPVLVGMGKRQKLKTIMKYAATTGKILGKEMLIRLLKHYDVPGTLLRLLGLIGG